MSDENVGGLPEPAAILYPHSGFRRDDHAKALWRTHGYDTGGEPFYSADQLHSHAAARVHAALSAHGQPVVDGRMVRGWRNRFISAQTELNQRANGNDYELARAYAEATANEYEAALTAALTGANP